MSCFHPLRAWRSKTVNENGKRPLVFDHKLAQFSDRPFDLPCGRCTGCRLERSRQWAIRIMHESMLYDDNCFLTLTYDDDNLPSDGGLRKKHFQDFMKRLRKKHSGVRYYHSGEYGDTTNRPHYHSCMFGYRPDDLKHHKNNNQGHPLYTSEKLDTLWGHGHVTVGDLSFDSAAYVARYVMKKITGPGAEDHYTRLNISTGELVQVEPEYSTMSLGIGKEFYNKYAKQLNTHDNTVMNGSIHALPKYYDSLLDRVDPELLKKIKRERVLKASAKKHNNTLERLRVRESVKESQISTLKRSL